MSQAENQRGGRVYLDNAATTWPKSEAAVEASIDFIRCCGAASGRGAYASAQAADRWLESARKELANLLHCEDPQCFALCNSGTHALNAVLFGLLSAGDHVITTSMEHNSVLRPLSQLSRVQQVTFDVCPANAIGRVYPRDAKKLVRKNTKVVVVGHASNVTGAANDLTEWKNFAQACGLLLVVDASQSLGYLPIDLQSLQPDALAAAGHKGLRGLQGTGLVFLSKALQQQVQPLMVGGTGNASERIDEVPQWPQVIEVGNLNMPGVVSMAAAAKELNHEEDLESGWLPVFERLISGLQELPGMELLGEYNFAARPRSFVPVVSLRVAGWDAHDLATILDTAFQIEVRAGWHCAALVHEAIGTADQGGTLRISSGRSTTIEDIEYTLQVFREILSTDK